MNDNKRVYVIPILSMVSDLNHRYQQAIDVLNRDSGFALEKNLTHRDFIQLVTELVEEQLYQKSMWAKGPGVDEIIGNHIDWFTMNVTNPYYAVSQYFYQEIMDPIILQIAEILNNVDYDAWDLWELRPTSYSLILTYLGDYRIAHFETSRASARENRQSEFELINSEVLSQIKKQEKELARQTDSRSVFSFFERYLSGPCERVTTIAKSPVSTKTPTRDELKEAAMRVSDECTNPRAFDGQSEN